MGAKGAMGSMERCKKKGDMRECDGELCVYKAGGGRGE